MTIYLTEWRGKYRRELNRLDNAKARRALPAVPRCYALPAALCCAALRCVSALCLAVM